MNFLKRNKITIIAVAIFLVIVLLLFQIKNIFFPSKENAIYGSRTKGIEKVEVSKSTKEQVEEKFNDTVTDSNIRVAGRLININLTVKEEVSRDTAKSYADQALEPFSEEQKKYYDFQVFIEKETDSNEFPIIGYRHHTKGSFTWTKDRTENAS